MPVSNNRLYDIGGKIGWLWINFKLDCLERKSEAQRS